MRSNSRAGTFGFWICSAKACGWESLLIASAIGTLRRPIETMRRGHGGSSGKLDSTERRSRERHEKLKRRRQEPRPGGANPPQAEGEADRLGDGGSLRLHADRAVGHDPRLRAAGVARPRGLRKGKISGTVCAQFLFDSFAYRT